jgi:hypothetical protein
MYRMSELAQPMSNQSLEPTAGRSHDAGIRVHDEADNVIQTHEHKGDFKEW